MSSGIKTFYPDKNAVNLIVRPVYDQTTPVVNKDGNPFGLPSNLEEQRETWRALVPCYKNSKEINDELFKVTNLSDHKRSRLVGVPAYEHQLRYLDTARRISKRAAKCLALILITEKGEGSPGQGDLGYNWHLCTEVFGAAFSKQYREFIRRLGQRSNGYGDKWT